MNPSYIAANWTPEIWKYPKYQRAFPYVHVLTLRKYRSEDCKWILATVNSQHMFFPRYDCTQFSRINFWILRWIQSYFWRKTLESMMYLTCSKKPDLTNSDPVSSKQILMKFLPILKDLSLDSWSPDHTFLLCRILLNKIEATFPQLYLPKTYRKHIHTYMNFIFTQIVG